MVLPENPTLPPGKTATVTCLASQGMLAHNFLALKQGPLKNMQLNNLVLSPGKFGESISILI